jgi:hypothetical protein
MQDPPLQLRIISATPGHLKTSLKVEQRHLNNHKVCHLTGDARHVGLILRQTVHGGVLLSVRCWDPIEDIKRAELDLAHRYSNFTGTFHTRHPRSYRRIRQHFL